jgi:hypothetical protein
MIGVKIDTKHSHCNHRDPSLHHHHRDARHLNHRANAFVGEAMSPTTTATSETTSESSATSTPGTSHVLAMDEIRPIFKFKSKRTGNTKVLNLHGLHHLLVILLTMPMWMIGLEAMHALEERRSGEVRSRWQDVVQVLPRHDRLLSLDRGLRRSVIGQGWYRPRSVHIRRESRLVP